jgi:lysozyme family protein
MAVFDLAVNSGPGRAAKMLQRVLGVPEDGMIGPKTLEKVASIDVGKLVEDYNAQRLTFLQALPTWETFGKGWGRRVAEVSKDAEKMMA